MDFQVDRHSKTPSWIQVRDTIRNAIEGGELRPGQAVPSLRQIIEQTGLAMATVQKAIRWLEDNGLIYTVSGRGTFVRKG